MNNREIKFRARSKETGEVFQQLYNGQCFQWLHEGQNIIIEQYTGVKDKNGVEIYEGDIVEVFGNRVYYVGWTEDCYGGKAGWDLLDSDGECHEFYYGGFDSSSCQVVGNIHENPELLEKK